MSLNIPNNTEHWAVVVAQLAERSLPTRGPRFESRHQQFFLFTYFQDENELKEAAANGPISKITFRMSFVDFVKTCLVLLQFCVR